MKILCGPPGTGKTWLAAREAVKAIEPERFRLAEEADDADARVVALHSELVAEGRILWVSFHPSYSYEDFVEGYRPVVDELGQLSYRVVDGPFKSLCQRAGFKADLQIGEQLVDGAGKPAGLVVGKDAGGWIVEVSVGRKDAVAAKLKKYVSRYVVNRILELGLPPSIFSIPGAGLLPLSNFGVDPRDEDVPSPRDDEDENNRQGSTIRKIVAGRSGVMSSSDLSNASHVGSVVRRLAKLRSLESGSATPVVLVIDEINRSDTSRVFGELLTLLESDKREGMAEQRSVSLPYSRELFSVPKELSIIGTMNTVDRSLATLDFAMRRRFDFQEVLPNPELVMSGIFGSELQDLHRRINARLKILVGTGYEIGHSFFMQQRFDSIRQSQGWMDAHDGDYRALAHIFRSNLIPTLAQYLINDWSKVQAVAGAARTTTGLETLFESPVVDPAFAERLSEDFEPDSTGLGVYEGWWDPSGRSWDHARFQQFVSALAAGR